MRGIFLRKMTERILTEEIVRLLRPAIRERLEMPDNCDGCFDPLGNKPRRIIVGFSGFIEGFPTKADFFKQHRECFENGVPVRRSGVENA